MIKVIRHDTLDEVLESFFPQEVLEAPGEWTINDFGLSLTAEGFVEAIRENHPCWGFARNPKESSKEEIHVWIGPEARYSDVLGLMAHEYGHFEFEQSDEEEQCEAYCRVAVYAWQAANDLLACKELPK